MVQGQGGREVQPGGILEYFEDLNRAPNAEIGPKDFFEMVSKAYASRKDAEKPDSLAPLRGKNKDKKAALSAAFIMLFLLLFLFQRS